MVQGLVTFYNNPIQDKEFGTIVTLQYLLSNSVISDGKVKRLHETPLEFTRYSNS